MCGRFALGVGAGQLAHDAAQQYFVPGPAPDRSGPAPPPASSPHPPADDDNDDRDDSSHRPNTPTSVQWASSDAEARFRPRYNVAPTTQVPILRRGRKDPHTLELDLVRWSLIPHWCSSPPDGSLSTINAQCESVFEATPAWRGPRDSKRCVVLAQGFYEWRTQGKEKTPYFVKRSDGKLMAFAGLWDHCNFKGAHEPVTSCTILTVPVNQQLRFLHSRMPAILSSGTDIALWLSDQSWNPRLQALIHPFPDGQLECYAVDRGVGKAGNESEDFIKPVAQKKGSLDQFFARQTEAVAASTTAGTKQRGTAHTSPRVGESGTDKTAKREGRDHGPEAEGSVAKREIRESARLPKREDDEAAEGQPSDGRYPGSGEKGRAGKVEETEETEEKAQAFNPDEDTPGRVGAVVASLKQKRKRESDGEDGLGDDEGQEKAGRQEGTGPALHEAKREAIPEQKEPLRRSTRAGKTSGEAAKGGRTEPAQRSKKRARPADHPVEVVDLVGDSSSSSDHDDNEEEEKVEGSRRRTSRRPIKKKRRG